MARKTKKHDDRDAARTFGLGFSPCPNDTFMFHALVTNKVVVDDVRFAPGEYNLERGDSARWPRCETVRRHCVAIGRAVQLNHIVNGAQVVEDNVIAHIQLDRRGRVDCLPIHRPTVAWGQQQKHKRTHAHEQIC